MSISEFFNKKSRAVIAATALALGIGGGYAGHEAAQRATQQPHVSEFTLAQIPDNMTEQQFIAGKLPANAKYDAQQFVRVDEFTTRIDVLETRKYGLAELNDLDRPAATARLMQDSAQLINDLRLSENLSERNYADLVKDFDARVGIDVTPLTGNYAKGIAFQQDAMLGTVFGMIFGDDDKTDAQLSREVGDGMLQGQKMADNIGLAGGAAGAALGGLLLVPLWRRRSYPKVAK